MRLHPEKSRGEDSIHQQGPADDPVSAALTEPVATIPSPPELPFWPGLGLHPPPLAAGKFRVREPPQSTAPRSLATPARASSAQSELCDAVQAEVNQVTSVCS
jgi:hypothetical protein